MDKRKSPLEERRYGSFQIGMSLLVNNYEAVLKLLEPVFITRCEFIYSAAIFQIDGVSPYFPMLPKDVIKPEAYDILMNNKTGELFFSNVKERGDN